MVTDSLGCQSAQELTLAEPPSWTLSAAPDAQTLLPGQMLQLLAQPSLPGIYAYTWTPAQGLSCTDCPNPLAQPTDTTFYQVVAVDTAGCEAQAGLVVYVVQEAMLFVPTAFSPNEDGVNDFFTLIGDPAVFERITLLQVFDRWGELVFEEKNLPFGPADIGWDGRFRGKALPMDVYVWQAEVLLRDGTVLHQAGDVTLVR